MSAGAERYPTLLSPLRIAGREFRNRVVCAPVFTGFNADSTFSERYADYVVERARGGTGWIVLEPAESHATARRELPPGRRAFDPEVVDNWRWLAEQVHEAGARVSTIIGHSGRNATWRRTGRPTWSATDYPAQASGEVPMRVTQAQIAEVVEGFGAVAGNAARAGFDGVEIQVTADYLLGSFLSPLGNDRDDEYGGELENRMRALAETLGAVRAAAGPDLLVGIRMSVDHQVPGGLEPGEAAEVVRRLRERGLLDYVSAIAGTYVRLGDVFPTMGSELAFLADRARLVREVAGLPVGVAGRIPDGATAESVLASGAADFVALGRPLIADPLWVRRHADGEEELLRRCLYCNQQCVPSLGRGAPISCAQNALAGRERAFRADAPARRRRRVLVVGAGPAGLEAACAAVEHGHEVVVVDRASEPGGRLRLAAAVPGREELAAVVAPRLATLERAGVPLLLGRSADAALVEEVAPDVVLQATGATPWRRAAYRGRPSLGAIDGLADEHVTALDDLAADPPRGETVLVAEETGTRAAIAVLEWLLARDCRVVAVTTAPHVGFPGAVDSQEWSRVVPAAVRAGLEVHPFAAVRAVDRGSATVVSVLSGAETTVEGVARVVVSFPPVSTPPLETDRPLVAIGDCASPRDAGAAILDGRRAIVELDPRGPHAAAGATGGGHAALGERSAIVLLLLGAALFGSNFVLVKVALRHADPFTVSFYRTLGGLATTVVLGLLLRTRVVASLRDLRRLVPAMVVMGASQLAFTFSVLKLDAGLASLLASTMPIFSVLVAWLVIREHPALVSLLGVALGFGGVALSSAGAEDPGSGATAIGVGAMLISTLTWAFGNVFIKRLDPPIVETTLVASLLGGATIAFAPFAAGVEGFAVDWEPGFVVGAAGSGILVQGLSGFILMRLLTRGTVLRTSSVIFLVPVFGVLSGAVFLGETIALEHVLGGLVVFAGIALVIAGGTRAHPGPLAGARSRWRRRQPMTEADRRRPPSKAL